MDVAVILPLICFWPVLPHDETFMHSLLLSLSLTAPRLSELRHLFKHTICNAQEHTHREDMNHTTFENLMCVDSEATKYILQAELWICREDSAVLKGSRAPTERSVPGRPLLPH